MENKKRKMLFYPVGLVVGLLNGLLGAGGGMAAIPMLKGLGVEPEECHATSIAIILPLAAASGALYLKAGNFNPSDALVYLPGGVAGAVFGAWLLPRIGTERLRRVFGAVVLLAAARLLLR